MVKTFYKTGMLSLLGAALFAMPITASANEPYAGGTSSNYDHVVMPDMTDPGQNLEINAKGTIKENIDPSRPHHNLESDVVYTEQPKMEGVEYRRDTRTAPPACRGGG